MTNRADVILRWVSGPDVLDIGSAGNTPRPSSDAWVFGRLFGRFPSVVGIDISEQNVTTLKALGFSGLQVADAQSFSLDQEFDTIVAGEVIEHLENPRQFLASARAHLKPSGRLVLTTPYAFGLLNWGYALIRFPTMCINPEHTMWFCPRTLKELAGRAGFAVEHWELLLDLPDEPNPPVLLKRAVVALFRVFARLLPKRLRCNGMLFVFRVN